MTIKQRTMHGNQYVQTQAIPIIKDILSCCFSKNKWHKPIRDLIRYFFSIRLVKFNDDPPPKSLSQGYQRVSSHYKKY